MASRTRFLRTSMAGRVRAPLFFALALLSLLALRHPALSRKPAPTPCPGGRFLLPAGSTPILSGGSADPDVVTIDDGHTPPLLAIASGCLAAPGTRKATKKRTTVKGQWPTCGAVAKVKLTAHVDAATCRTMTGTVTAKHTKRRRFTAVRSACGDGVVDPGAGEECEPGVLECDAGVCAQCTCAGPTTTTLPGTPTTSTTLPGGGTTTTTVTGGTTSTTLGGGATTTTLPTQPPPDPATIAPPNPRGVTTDFAGSIAFLYGPGGVQSNVTPGAIVAARAAVLRGRVVGTAGAALPAVLVSVLDHPEWGQTLTRADGMFDFVVNAGAGVVLRYQKTGYLEIQRPGAPPVNDWEVMPDVVLTALDAAVTAVTLTGATTTQIAQGSTMTDGSGARRATVLFPAGTTAEMVMPDGSTHALGTLHVRATEFTVGAPGHAAMPGVLPPSSGYTYAVELSADEAVAAGATEVRFNQPVPLHVDNFIGFPVGSGVPVGFYDRQRGVWEALPDGRVIAVLGVTAGLANLDTDGDGLADDATKLAALGVTDGERQALATLYPNGGSLWRTLVPHFTAFDDNWGLLCGNNASCGFPPDPWHRRDRPKGGPCGTSGSIISCETQMLGETVPVTGTPFRLYYTSLQAPGRTSENTIKIPVSGPTLPDITYPAARIEATASVAGRHFSTTLPLLPNQVFEITWDGNDAYGRRVHGVSELVGTIDWILEGAYESSGGSSGSSGSASFGVPASGGFARVPSGRIESVFNSHFAFPFGSNLDARGEGLGGWTLDVHHTYDPHSGRVYFGTGAMLDPAEGSAITVGGNGPQGLPVIGAQATATSVEPYQIAGAPDGGFYFSGILRAYQVSPSGVVSRLGCDDIHTQDCLEPTDGLPLSQVAFVPIGQMKAGPDGQLYLTNGGDATQIWRIDTTGIVRLVAGSGGNFSGPPVEGTLARDVALDHILEIAPAPDGSVYFYTDRTFQIWRIFPDGRLAIVAGDGTPPAAFVGDGGFGRAATLPLVYDIAVDPSGNLYAALQNPDLVVRLRPDGIIERFAGGGSCAVEPFGLPRLDACLIRPGFLAIGADGVPAVAEVNRSTILRLGDTIFGLAGGSNGASTFADGAAPSAVMVDFILPVFAFSNRGTLLLRSGGKLQGEANPSVYVKEIQTGPPRLPDGTIAVPSGSGSVVYLFDPATGRHLSTRDRLTGAIVHQFGYDAAGRLASVTDGAGNVTTVEHAGDGSPTAIVAPGGQRTALAVDANGFLASVTDPAGEAATLTYAGVANGFAADSGLLKTFRLPSGTVSTFGYEPDGDLASDTNPLGGTTTLMRTDHPDGREVAVTTPTGQTTVYGFTLRPDGVTERYSIDPAGAETVATVTPDEALTTTYADGTVATIETGPDPRFGRYLPVLKSATITKGQLPPLTAHASRTITTPGTGFLGVDVLTEATIINQVTWTSVFDRLASNVRRSTPGGRLHAVTFDALGRATQVSGDPAYAPYALGYGARGLLTQVTHGTQQWTYGYDVKNRLASVADAASHAQAYTFDTNDRPTAATFAAGETTAIGWDQDSMLVGFTPPVGAAHTIGNTALGDLASYTAPGNPALQKQYRLDGSLAKIVLPSGRAQTFSRDAAGRPSGFTYPEAAVVVTYPGTLSFPATVVRTPTGAGTAQTLTSTYTADLLATVAASGAATGTYTYDYDANFRVRSVLLQSGADAVQYNIVRNSDRLMTTFGPLTLTRGGPDGALSAITAGTSTLALAYSPEGWLTSRTLTAGGQQRYALTVTNDASGLPTGRTETIAGADIVWAYTYDARGRLKRADRNGTEVEAYDYDANGNRIGAAYDGGASTSATYDAQDRLLSRGGTAYTFDADGFLATRGSDTFTYSATGELLAATVGASTVTYDWDAFGRRVRRTAGTAVTEYLYGDLADPFRVTAYRAPSGTLTTLLYDEQGLLVAFARGAQRFFVATDQVGSPRVVTNAAGAVVHVVEYDAFGRVRSDSDPTFDLPIGFAGGLADPVTGLVRFGLRDYEPASGRWTARDPAFLGGQDFNLYAYVGSTPVGARDPFGLFCVGGSVFEGVGGGGTICFEKKGISVCGEIGVGTSGTSIGLSPYAGLDKQFNGLDVAAGGNLGPLAALGVEGEYGQYGDPFSGGDPCWDGKGSIKGGVGPMEWESGQGGRPSKWGVDPLQILNIAGDLRHGEEVKINPLSAKAVFKSCNRY